MDMKSQRFLYYRDRRKSTVEEIWPVSQRVRESAERDRGSVGRVGRGLMGHDP